MAFFFELYQLVAVSVRNPCSSVVGFTIDTVQTAIPEAVRSLPIMEANPALKDLVIGRTLDLVRTAPEGSKSPLYEISLTPERMDSILKQSTFTFAPLLLEVMQDPSPAPVAYFKSLPVVGKGFWGIYMVVMEREAHDKPRVYTGSGTAAQIGVSERLRHYEELSEPLSNNILKSLREGFNITHYGVLCVIELPFIPMVPITRVFMVAMEAAFTFYFWTLSESCHKLAATHSHFCP
jgi:hypothetical protein